MRPVSDVLSSKERPAANSRWYDKESEPHRPIVPTESARASTVWRSRTALSAWQRGVVTKATRPFPVGAPRPTFHRGRGSRFLLWCGGVDRDLLHSRAETYRYTNAGIFVILVALVAMVTFSIYAWMIHGRYSYWFIPMALFWGTIVFFLDRSIMVEPSYGDLDSVGHTAAYPVAPGPARRRAWLPVQTVVRAASMLLRVVIAMIVAYLIAEALVLVIFAPEINAQLAELHKHDFAAVTQVEITNKQNQITQVKQELKDNATERQDAKNKVDTANKTYNDEIAGKGGTGKVGVGPAAAADREQLEQALKQEQEVDSRTNERDRQLTKDLDTSTHQLTALQQGGDAAVQADPDLADQKAKIYNNNGWEERERALNRFLDESRGTYSVGLIPWALRALFFAIDLIPISLKLLNKWTLYGRRQREHAVEIRYREREQHETDLRRVDLEAAIADRRTEVAHEVALSKEEWRRRWRIGHMEQR